MSFRKIKVILSNIFASYLTIFPSQYLEKVQFPKWFISSCYDSLP